MTREDAIRRGEAARRLLEDATAQAALAEIAAECTASWADSSPADVAAREDAYRLHRCVALLRQKLEAWAAGAALEKDRATARPTEP
jgi:hypothetical protein